VLKYVKYRDNIKITNKYFHKPSNHKPSLNKFYISQTSIFIYLSLTQTGLIANKEYHKPAYKQTLFFHKQLTSINNIFYKPSNYYKKITNQQFYYWIIQ